VVDHVMYIHSPHLNTPLTVGYMANDHSLY